jgi:hypothetical protein
VTDLRFPRLSADALVLERGASEWQVGLEPGRAVVFHGDGFRAVLRLLDGSHPLPMVRDVARRVGITRPQLHAGLAALLMAGLLDERDVLPISATPSSRVRLVGAGQLGRQVAALLVDSGLGELYIFDDEPPEPLHSSSALGSRGQALCSQLLGRGPGTITAVGHWSKPEAPVMDLTVVAIDRPEVDRLLTEHLVRTDQPHLLVRSHGSGVVVGPLVIPGRTSCVRCADLARRDADPHWPTVLNQLTRVSQTAPPALVAWAAAVTVVQALSFLAGGTPETAGATLEIGSSDHAMRLRSWPAHAECGCGWWPTAEWGA